jgi:hypothetical protein
LPFDRRNCGKLMLRLEKTRPVRPSPLASRLRQPLLYRRCDPAELPFAVCTELEEAPG